MTLHLILLPKELDVVNISHILFVVALLRNSQVMSRKAGIQFPAETETLLLGSISGPSPGMYPASCLVGNRKFVPG